jgi:hypothetical protein
VTGNDNGHVRAERGRRSDEESRGAILTRSKIQPPSGVRQHHWRRPDILDTAWRLGLRARLKKTGGEWTGPCPRCGGRDRFSISPSKGLWNCRGCGSVNLPRDVFSSFVGGFAGP